MDRLHRDAGGIHLQQQEGNTGLWFAIRIGTHKTEHAIGVMRVRGPDLGPVDDVVAAIRPIGHGPALQIGQVGARARFRVALTPDIFAGQYAGQIERFLRRAAMTDDRGTNQVQAHGRQQRRVRQMTGRGKDVPLHGRPARTAMIRRPAGRGPPLGMQDFLPCLTGGILHVEPFQETYYDAYTLLHIHCHLFSLP